MLNEIIDFMKKFGIEEITFGKSHSIKRTKKNRKSKKPKNDDTNR